MSQAALSSPRPKKVLNLLHVQIHGKHRGGVYLAGAHHFDDLFQRLEQGGPLLLRQRLQALEKFLLQGCRQIVEALSSFAGEFQAHAATICLVPAALDQAIRIKPVEDAGDCRGRELNDFSQLRGSQFAVTRLLPDQSQAQELRNRQAGLAEDVSRVFRRSTENSANGPEYRVRQSVISRPGRCVDLLSLGTVFARHLVGLPGGLLRTRVLREGLVLMQTI